MKRKQNHQKRKKNPADFPVGRGWGGEGKKGREIPKLWGEGENEKREPQPSKPKNVKKLRTGWSKRKENKKEKQPSGSKRVD